MFENLTEKISNAFKKFKNKGKLTEADVKEGMREVKLALLEADVNFKVVKEFVKTIEADSAKADIYEFENREGFCADGVLYGQKFTLRVSEKQTTEEFEADFSRLNFVKIGDLLSE